MCTQKLRYTLGWGALGWLIICVLWVGVRGVIGVVVAWFS